MALLMGLTWDLLCSVMLWAQVTLIKLHREQREQMSQRMQSRCWEKRTQLGTGWDLRREFWQWALELSI